jgi:hypothetical protein
LLFVSIALLVCLCGCKLNGDDPDDFNDGGAPSNGSPLTFLRSLFSPWGISRMKSQGVYHGGSLQGEITPMSTLGPMHSMLPIGNIGLIPETTVADLADKGFQAYNRGEGVVDADTLNTMATTAMPSPVILQPGMMGLQCLKHS